MCPSGSLSFVGVHLFARWLDQQEAFAPVVAELKEAIREHQSTHPDEDFALLHHRDATLGRRFQALLLAPLLGMERLSAFDTQVTGCKFSVAQMLCSSAQIEGNRIRRERCAEKNAWDSEPA